jgi:hypothetical protein
MTRSQAVASSRAFTRQRSIASAVLTLLAGTIGFAACSSDSTPTDGNELPRGALNITVDNSSGTALSLAPKAATLPLGHGTILKAQIVDGDGKPVAGAKAAWRSTNTAVARVTAMADSGLAIDNGRAVVASIGTGTALIIASYESFADTATVTIVPRTDSAPGSSPPPRPTKFDLTVRVWGSTPPITGNPADSALHPPLTLLPGSIVKVTLLPPRAGDTTSVGTTPITAPTLVGTATTDATGKVTFTGLTVARFRVDVTPPSGTTWNVGSVESGAPYWGTIVQDVWLRK